LHGINSDPISDGYATDVRLPGDSLRHLYPNNEDQRPATLWYHDHSLHVTAHHLFRGLAGLYILTDEVEDALPLPKGYGRYDIPLVIDDVMIDPETGVLYYDNCSHFGAFGDVMVVNGRQQPRLQVANRRYRFRILNASDARQYVLALDDGSTFHTIGSDHGLLDAPVATDNQHLVVAERVEIVIDFARYPVGSRVVLVNKLVEPGDPVHQIMAFDVTRQETDDSRLPATLRPTGDPAPPRAHRRFELARRGGMWTINGLRWDQNRVDAFPQLNSTEEWELVNGSGGWGHPMHIHLGRFKIVSIEGRARRPDETGWKDTVWVGPNQTVRVVHEFKNFTGRFMFHCHNSSHEDHTMMTQFDVIPGPPDDGPAPPRSPEPDGAPQQVPPPPETSTTPAPDEFAKLRRRTPRRRPTRLRKRRVRRKPPRKRRPSRSR
jgi:FtsP/CotA-like multicopper oxidase with cupredoxin domain